MPSSFQPPIRQDNASGKTHSQTTASNTAAAPSLVWMLMKEKGGGIISIAPGDTLGKAVEVLRDNRIGALAVTNERGELCGILSERDIVRKLADTPGRTLPQKVQDIMVEKVVTCAPDDDLMSVLTKMRDGRFRHMPVVDDGALVGMVTIGDVVNYRLNEVEHEALQLKQLIVG
ncbi:MAG: CBS domain-containing protein [Pseudomonadota bacterium]